MPSDMLITDMNTHRIYSTCEWAQVITNNDDIKHRPFLRLVFVQSDSTLGVWTISGSDES